MECLICYESVTADNLQVLECAHSLCHSCLGNLRNRVCPFCRNPIQSSSQQPPTITNDQTPVVVHINIDLETAIVGRPRRRRRRRRSGLQLPTISPVRVPRQLSVSEVEELNQQTIYTGSISDPRGEVSSPRDSRSDRNRQRCRRARNRWKQYMQNQGNISRAS